MFKMLGWFIGFSMSLAIVSTNEVGLLGSFFLGFGLSGVGIFIGDYLDTAREKTNS